MKCLVVAEHCSARFGGEAILPLHHFNYLRRAGVDTWLLTHSRTRSELLSLFPESTSRIVFSEDTWLQVFLARVREKTSLHSIHMILDSLSHAVTQLDQRAKAKRLIRSEGIDFVLEPMPVSPKQPSLMFGLGAPVIVGPLNGGMAYPPAFRSRQGFLDRALVALLRWLSGSLHLLFPGKRRASLILVANQRTRDALPWSVKHVPVEVLVENGIEPERWSRPRSQDSNSVSEAFRFAFVGRLVPWKGVDILLAAFARFAGSRDGQLHVFGDGPERPGLEHAVRALGLEGRVIFHGFVAQDQLPAMLSEMDSLVLPSLFESGGAVVLEAMALGLPVIATNWGGPADYLDERCGILVEPESASGFEEGLLAAMTRLAEDPELARQLGAAGHARALKDYSWPAKIDRLLEFARIILGRG